MLKIIACQSDVEIPQMTIMGSRKAPLSNKNDAKIVGQVPFEALHPKYPKGAPQGKGGEFMPKGSSDYKTAVANNLVAEVKKGNLTIEQARQLVASTQKNLKDVQKEKKSFWEILKNPIKAFKERKEFKKKLEAAKHAKNAAQKQFLLAKSANFTAKHDATSTEIKDVLSQWNNHTKNLNTPKPLQSKMRDNQHISEAILNRHDLQDVGNIVVSDSRGNPQSVLLYDKEQYGDSIYVSWLATAPWNIYDPSEEKSVKGAGAKAIIQAVKESMKQGLEGKITLESLPDAVPFYEHLGFKKQRVGKNMVLSPEAAQNLLKKYS